MLRQSLPHKLIFIGHLISFHVDRELKVCVPFCSNARELMRLNCHVRKPLANGGLHRRSLPLCVFLQLRNGWLRAGGQRLKDLIPCTLRNPPDVRTAEQSLIIHSHETRLRVCRTAAPTLMLETRRACAGEQPQLHLSSDEIHASRCQTGLSRSHQVYAYAAAATP